MRLWTLLSAIFLLSIVVSGYFYRDDLLQYRSVRVGLTQTYRFIDSLFNDNYDEEEEQIEDMFEYLVASEPTDENAESQDEPEETTCYSWPSLNGLIDEVHQRIMNNTIAMPEKRHRIETDLRKSITSVEQVTESFEARLSWFSDHLDSLILPTTDNYFGIIRKSLKNIKEFEQTVKKLITKMDANHMRTQRGIIVRLAKVQRQFEKVLQSQKDAHLECTCDVVKTMDDVTTAYFGGMDDCVEPVIERFKEVLNALEDSMRHVMEYVMHATLPGIKPKESVYDIHYKMPAQVRKIQKRGISTLFVYVAGPRARWSGQGTC